MRLFIVLVVACIGLCSAPVFAADPTALLNEAHAAEQVGNTVVALEKYAAAYELAPRFDTAAGLGLAEAGAKRNLPAARHLSEALAWFPSDGSPALRKHLEGKLAQVKTTLAEVVIETVAGATIVVDGEVLGVAPLNRAVFVEPGEHAFAASLGAQSARVRRSVATGTTRLVLTLAAQQVDAGAVALITIGTALSIAGFGVGAGLLIAGDRRIGNATEKRERLDGLALGDPCNTHPTVCEEIENNGNAGDDHRLAGGILVGAGGLFAVGTIIYALTLTLGDDAPQEQAIVPLISTDGAGLMLRFGF